ncbi:MAG: MFS transporter [Alphaproteobacteria bacterium]|nr:MFS transporter [Alphaproteobacteria bacterium]
MLAALPSIAALLLAVALLQLGHGLLSTAIGVTMAQLRFGPETIGFVSAAYSLGYLVGARTSIVVLQRVGHIRGFASFAAVLATASLGLVLIVDPVAWTAFRFLMGMAIVGVWTATESWLNERSTQETRGQILSVYLIASYAAAAVGPLLLALMAGDAARPFIAAAALLSLCLVPVAASRSTSPPPPEPTAFGLRTLYRISPLGLVGCVLSGMLQGTTGALGPIYAQRVGLDIGDTALFMTCMIAGGLALQWPIGRLSDVTDRRTVIVFAAIGCAGASALLVVADPGALLALLALSALFGAMSFAVYPLCVSHANDFIMPRDRVAASSGLLVCYGLGAFLAPFPCAYAMERLGPGGLFIVMALLAAALAAFGLWRMTQRPTVAAADRQPFVDRPSTSYAAADLDPYATTAEEQLELPLQPPPRDKPGGRPGSG